MKDLFLVLVLLFNFSDELFAQWTDPRPIEPTGTHLQAYPVMALGPNRQIAIACEERDNNAVYLSTDNGKSFVRHPIPPPPVQEFRFWSPTGVAFDSHGAIFVLWNWNERYTGEPVASYLTLSRSTDGGVTFETFWESRQPFLPVKNTPLIIDSDDNIHIIQEIIVSPFSSRKIYTKFVRGNVQNPVMTPLPYPEDTLEVCYYVSLLVRGSKIHFASDAAGKLKIYYCQSNDGGMSFAKMVKIDTSDATTPSLFADATGKTGVLYKRLAHYDSTGPMVRVVGDSGVNFSSPWSLGALTWWGTDVSFATNAKVNYLAYDGAVSGQGVAALYKFADLRETPLDSVFFSPFFLPTILVDSLGGMYFAMNHWPSGGIYFTSRDVVSHISDHPTNQGEQSATLRVRSVGRDDLILEMELSETRYASISIYDVLGRLVQEVAQGSFLPGLQTFHVRTVELTSGVYFAVLQSKGKTVTTKLAIVR